MGFGVDFDYVDDGFFFMGMIEKFVIVQFYFVYEIVCLVVVYVVLFFICVIFGNLIVLVLG